MGELNFKNNNGQSLMELLVAVGVGVIIILTGVSTVAVYLRVSSQDITFQHANFFAQELIDNVNVTAEGEWSKIVNAASNSYLATSTMGFAVISGQENRAIDSTIYTRYFYSTSVCRDAGESIVDCSSGIDDPFTKKLNVKVEWLYRNATTSISLEKFLTKTNNEVIFQTNWVGGPLCATSFDPIAPNYNTAFCTSTPGLDFSSNPGLIKIQGY